MNEFLISKGFTLNKYEDGVYYEWIHNANVHKENVAEVMNIFGFNEEQCDDTFILQCDRNLNNCRVYNGYDVWTFDFIRFIGRVNRIK